MAGAAAESLILLGRPLAEVGAWCARIAALFSETIFWSALGWSQRSPVRSGAVARHIADVGLGSLPLTALFGVAIGVVMGIQLDSLLTLADVLNPFIEGFVSVLMTQVAPLLMGILVATRSGTALVAALARMRTRRELDALVGMGLEPVRYLLAPVFLATLVAVPILNLVLTVVSLVFLSIYVAAMSGFTWQLVLGTAVDLITAHDVIVCLLKGVLFATIVSIVSGGYGLAIVGGRTGVGRTLTRSSVVTIGLILIANAIVTVAGQ